MNPGIISGAGTLETGPVCYVNDQPRALAEGLTLADLVGEMGLSDRKGIAVAVNGSVVPRPGWAGRTLAPADRVLVIRATQGG